LIKLLIAQKILITQKIKNKASIIKIEIKIIIKTIIRIIRIKTKNNQMKIVQIIIKIKKRSMRIIKIIQT